MTGGGWWGDLESKKYLQKEEMGEGCKGRDGGMGRGEISARRQEGGGQMDIGYVQEKNSYS